MMDQQTNSASKTNSYSRYRWFVVAIFFAFMLLHQSDKLLIGPLTDKIIDSFNITYTQMGAVTTGALIVGAVFYPVWGMLQDRYSRAKLLAAASFIWGSTTWFGAVAPTYPLFVAARASTGIDDSSYPGLYSMVSDYFSPKMRGKIYGLLQLAQPIGYLVGMLMALVLADAIGWRSIFYITGTLGIVLAIMIYFGVKEPPRGHGEPELAQLGEMAQYHFEWKIAADLFRKPSLILLYIQGFFGVFPWNVITYWFFTYLADERKYESDSILMTMLPAILVLALGYPVGGALGDHFFKKNPRGRVYTSAAGVIIGAIMLLITMNIPLDNPTLFMVMLTLTAFFIPFASPNVISTIYDVTLPEVRSTANATSGFIENIGAALAPLIAGIIADQSSLREAIILICTSTWILCFIFFIGVAIVLPKDVKKLRTQLQERANIEQSHQTES